MHCLIKQQPSALRWIAACSYIIIPRHGPLAQWLEQATHNRLVVGSNPTGATKYQGLTITRKPLVFFQDTYRIRQASTAEYKRAGLEACNIAKAQRIPVRSRLSRIHLIPEPAAPRACMKKSTQDS